MANEDIENQEEDSTPEEKKRGKLGRKKNHDLTIRDRVMIEQYIHNGGKKIQAYALAFMEIEFDLLDDTRRLTCRIKATQKWRDIEEKLGGMNGVLEEMGIDNSTLVKETIRLTRLKKPMYCKDAQLVGYDEKTNEPIFSNIVWYDDGTAQAKAIEMLHRIKGSFLEAEKKSLDERGTPLRIEFQNFGKIEDADNVQVSFGKPRNPLPVEAPKPEQKPES